MIKNLIKSLGLMATLTLFASQAQAVITLTPADCNLGVNCWTTNDNSQPDANSIETLVGTSSDLFELYKNEVGGDALGTGTFAGSYETTFSNTALDPQDAFIEYISGEVINCGECYLTIKDGKNTPALYAFDISGWNGMESISLEGFWPDSGAISNIAIWGATTSNVPLPATIGLLAVGLMGLRFAGKRRA